ncbi:MAG: phytoene desaturase family protein [bacterium]
MDDVALVIGAGIGGLITGALLVKRGWRVIILEQSSRIGGCCGSFSRSGFTFDIGATLFPDILWSGLDLVCRELGLELDRIFVDPFAQVCIPGHRIGLYRDAELTREEWSREFPDERERISGVLKSLHRIEERVRQHHAGDIPGQFSAEMNKAHRRFQIAPMLWTAFRYPHRSARGMMHRALRNGKVLPGFDLQTLFWGQTECRESSLAYTAMVSGLHLNGGFCLRGGGISLCNTLSQYIQMHGGEIRFNSPVKEIMMRKRRAVGLQLATGEVLEGRCYIANTVPWVLYERLLSEGFIRNRMIRMLSRVPSPHGVFTLFLGVKESCLPSQMGHKVFFLPPMVNEEEWIGPLFISLAPQEDEGRAPDKCRAMTVFHYTSTKGWYRGKEYRQNKEWMESRVLHTLKGLIPFLDEGICVHESATPLTYEEFTGRPGGVVNGIPQVHRVAANRALSDTTCYRDLFMISDCTSPGLGVEGICQSSLKLVDRICKRYE